MNIVYILRSVRNSNLHYMGVCNDLKARLTEHNTGECKATNKGGPWKVETAIYFSDEKKATAFERYLKTGSGRAFSKKRL